MGNERILVVDDEKGVVLSCVRILEREGFTVSGITDSQKVAALLKQEAFDLLLTDIRMPKIDGLQLLQLAKEIDPHLTVILITGYGTMEDAIKAIGLGAQGFLMKPFETEDLIATIEENLARRALLRDSLRLQTLLPLLEINQILQSDQGETALAQRVLEIALNKTRAARLVWLSRQASFSSPTGQHPQPENEWLEMAIVPKNSLASILPPQAVDKVLSQAQPVWLLSNGELIDSIDGRANIIGALLPVIIKGEIVGLLTAETGEDSPAPFDPISLDLLSVLAGQLAMMLENVQLFNQAKALHTFNDNIINNMTNGLITVNKQNKITAFNPAAAAMLGQNPDQVLNESLQSIFAKSPELVDIFQKTLRTNKPHTGHEISMQRQDDSQLPISINTAPLSAAKQTEETTGVVGVLEDLSERKAIEAERRRLDRLAALGEMSAVVAHEIRNPIAGIAAGVEYMTSKTAPDSAQAQSAAMIQSEIQRVNRILEDILFVARPFRLNLSTEDLAQIIDNVVQRCQPQIEAGYITVSTTHAPNLPPAMVDRQRLEQVFTNLVINATQAMQNDAQQTEEPQLIIETKIGTKKSPQQIITTIADTGPGIPAEVQLQIFEPFFTTKARGTGLGLSVARRVIEEHSGTIKINDSRAKGACFIISLPVAQGE